MMDRKIYRKHFFQLALTEKHLNDISLVVSRVSVSRSVLGSFFCLCFQSIGFWKHLTFSLYISSKLHRRPTGDAIPFMIRYGNNIPTRKCQHLPFQHRMAHWITSVSQVVRRTFNFHGYLKLWNNNIDIILC